MTARRRVAHVLAAFCIAAIPFVLISPASADSVGSFGWWYSLNQGLPVTPPPPPNAPESGIYLQKVSGAEYIAYGAVQFSNSDATAGIVTFNVESVTPESAEVALCPTTESWQSGQASTFADAPAFVCDGPQGKSIGVFNADQTQLTFNITDQLSNGNGLYDLAVVNDPVVDATVELSLTIPGGTFFTPTATSPSTVPPVSEPTPQVTFVPRPAPPPDAPTSFGAPAPDIDSSTDLGGFLDEPEPPVTETPTGADTGGETFQPSTGDEISGAPVSVQGPKTTGQRIAAGIGLALLAVGLWAVGTRGGEVLDPALKSAGAITAAGGVGRFARVRTHEPIKLT